ncbi:hypothetical protein [Flavobacterium pallidum]|uniref:DUF304 domain-containing protein n=1 Tax=Flavobacterium pallidum TaxID=2172098 RepID=A0A2S1SFW2_9FLAO|nr:hypothetical protein [Flavobacterium pallidum]AWI25227.1 hypothetical protein HYN49_04580 [Flavobacterium pallidum]
MSTLTLSATTSFCIEDDILNLFEGTFTHTFYLSHIKQMYLVRKKVLPASGYIGKLLQQYISASWKLHIVSVTGEKAVIPVRNTDRQAYIELISMIRKGALAA